ncbi:D-alanyl-D-alanine carboxypeptidase family protein [Lysinibacillus fusiformis]|uniref:D-alanyl-D-alanine carboxypeptidase family protein n=1 Tax=Ureibacillus chungkukjangi TaxID=1202712 RepID=UPI000D376F70|nr:D-alanyl-D-alanine carboxypeptidase family protein [Ureibacillus chungkukjangi]MCM3389328.1 D-alanyl-D-alanine carboxypeptidase [Ureibacillus chungkukjangi]MDI7743492.1 D-alanyl-D-alanine carboxypeptidase family protein [Lysinibacillus fusiformis]
MRKIIIIVITVVAFNCFPITKALGASLPPALASEAAIVLEANSGQVLYEKNSKDQMYPASLTKIATAIYAIETGELDDLVTVSSNARDAEGTTVYLEEGERVTLKKLLQGLLINSGNDAGIAIAEHLSGSVEEFSNDLNAYLKSVVEVQNTNFENPHGLFDSQHVTTAEDLAKITQYAMQNKVFKEIFGTKELNWDGETWDTTLITHHKILKDEIPYEEVTGGKTGYINQSGFTLATTAENEELSLIVITLNSSIEEEIYHDTVKLIDYAFDNYETTNIQKGTTFKLGDEEYRNAKTISYTSSINEQLNKKVNKDGTLNIIGEDDNLVATYPLEKVESITSKKIVEKSNTGNSFYLEFSIFIVLILSLIALYLNLKFSRSSSPLNRSKHQ